MTNLFDFLLAWSWPPVKGNRQFFTAPGRQLAAARPNDGTSEPFQADFTVGSGTETRYERIAAIVDHERSSWGNHAPIITPDVVKRAR